MENNSNQVNLNRSLISIFGLLLQLRSSIPDDLYENIFHTSVNRQSMLIYIDADIANQGILGVRAELINLINHINNHVPNTMSCLFMANPAFFNLEEIGMIHCRNERNKITMLRRVL